MKYFIILLIASFVFFGCDANNAGDNNDGDSSVIDGNAEDPGNTGGTTDPGNTGGTTDPGSNGSTGPFAGLGLCVGSWGEVENGTTISHENEDYSSIINQAGLEAIEDDLTAHYILCDDISLNDTITQAINPSLNEFTGTLEGNNRTISNLRIQALQDDYVGLFSKIGGNGEVRNLKLALAVDGDSTNPSISGNAYVGALVGENMGTITNVRVTGGYVKGTGNNVGGLVGSNEGGTIAQSYAISGVESSGSQLGGLVGNNAGTITASYATGTVSGTSASSQDIGGLVGYNVRTITASYATGDVIATGGQFIGGLVGDSIGPITASYFDATTTGQSDAGAQGVTAYHTYTDPVDGDDLVYTQANGTGDKIDQSNFPTWDDTIWTWQEGQWPTFQFQ